MSRADRAAYDAIIIGAGVGGLVCGCYLAKAGMKILIAERHYKPGGYCTSFKRQGVTFDAAAHSFGGYKFGYLEKIFDDLGINSKIKVKRSDPSDIVTTPEYKVAFWADSRKTISDFQSAFPKESDGIEKLIIFLTKPDPMSFARIKSWTFSNLLDRYIHDDKLKAILSFPLLGNGALPPSRMSAFIGAKIFQEYLLDGGYHPVGGMQTLSDTLAEIFRQLGGELRLSTAANKIIVNKAVVEGVTLQKDGFFSSEYVISNCDARQTFIKLLGENIVSQDWLCRINNMVPSLSTFIVYLIVDKFGELLPRQGINNWYLSQYDLDKIYLSAKKGDFRYIDRYLVYISPDQKTILAYLNAPYKSKKYWDDIRHNLADNLIKTIELHTIPNLSKHIIYKETATPHTLYRYTLNYAGAAYGWESTPNQLAHSDFRKPFFIRNLYLVGHWTTHGLGIPGVMYSGYDTAKMLLRKKLNNCT